MARLVHQHERSEGGMPRAFYYFGLSVILVLISARVQAADKPKKTLPEIEALFLQHPGRLVPHLNEILEQIKKEQLSSKVLDEALKEIVTSSSLKSTLYPRMALEALFNSNTPQNIYFAVDQILIDRAHFKKFYPELIGFAHTYTKGQPFGGEKEFHLDYALAESVPDLLRLLKESRFKDEALPLIALLKIYGKERPEVCETLIHLAESSSTDSEIARAALIALHELPLNENGVEALIRIADSGSSHARTAAEVLIKAPRFTEAQYEEMIQAAGRQSREVSEAILNVISNHPSNIPAIKESVGKYLVGLISGTSVVMRTKAARTLVHWGIEDSNIILNGLLNVATTHRDPEFRTRSKEELISLGLQIDASKCSQWLKNLASE